MDVGGRREIEAAADIMRDDRARPRRDRTRHLQPLAIAARERAGRRLRTGRANLKPLDQLAA